MKIKWTFLSSLLAILLVLSACGTAESNDTGVDSTEVEDNATEEIEVDEEAEEEEEEVEVETDVEGDLTDDSSEEESEADTEEEQVETTTEESETPDVALEELVASDNQDFSMKLLPHYELSGEEPGRDIVYTKEDDSHFMRIETMENEEGNYDYLSENMLVVLEASGEGETPTELTDADSLPAADSITKPFAYTVDSTNGPVTGIIFEQEDLIVRLTIFDSENNDYFKDFLAMGETITLTK